MPINTREQALKEQDVRDWHMVRLNHPMIKRARVVFDRKSKTIWLDMEQIAEQIDVVLTRKDFTRMPSDDAKWIVIPVSENIRPCTVEVKKFITLQGLSWWLYKLVTEATEEQRLKFKPHIKWLQQAATIAFIKGNCEG